MAREGAGLREPGIPSLPRSPSRGADETYRPVCMMKSSWLTTSLPSPSCSHPLCASSLPGLLPPSFSSYNSQKQEGFWRFTLNLGLLPARPGHVCLFSRAELSLHQGAQPDPRTKAPAKGSWRFVPLGLPNTAPRPRSLSMCLLMHCHAVFLDAAARNSNQVEWVGGGATRSPFH